MTIITAATTPIVEGEPIRLVGPSALAVSIEDAIAHSRLPPDNSEMLSIMAILKAAIHSVETETGLGLITQTWRQTFSGWPTVMRLRRRPLQMATGSPSVPAVTVSYRDADNALQLLDGIDYYVTGVRGDKFGATLTTASSWPGAYAHPEAVTVDYVVGYGNTPAAVPDLIKHAVLLTFGTFYDSRENLTIERVAEVPHAARHLLRDWRPLAVA